MELFFSGLLVLSVIIGSILASLSNRKLDREINTIIDKSKTDGTNVWIE